MAATQSSVQQYIRSPFSRLAPPMSGRLSNSRRVPSRSHSWFLGFEGQIPPPGLPTPSDAAPPAPSNRVSGRNPCLPVDGLIARGSGLIGSCLLRASVAQVALIRLGLPRLSARTAIWFRHLGQQPLNTLFAQTESTQPSGNGTPVLLAQGSVRTSRRQDCLCNHQEQLLPCGLSSWSSRCVGLSFRSLSILFRFKIPDQLRSCKI